MKNKIETILSGNWDELKGTIKSEWGKLSDNDLKQIDGSYDNLVGKIKKIYGYESAEIEEKIADLLSADTSGIKEKGETLVKNISNTLSEQTNQIKSIVEENMAKYFDKAKDVTANVEENIIQYCRKNPMKSIGLAALAGYAFAAIMNSKKSS